MSVNVNSSDQCLIPLTNPFPNPISVSAGKDGKFAYKDMLQYHYT